MEDKNAIELAKDHFETLISEQLERVEKMKIQEDWMDYSLLKPIKIGLIGGDGVGPYIMKESKRVLEFILKDEIENKNVEIKEIEGLTIENRLKLKKSVPDDILKKIKDCHVILKGPTTTPSAGDDLLNLESANITLRRELDLFANIRPIKIIDLEIDWVFVRENSEGSYLLGSQGVDISDDLSIDFRVITSQGAERILDYAFSYAKKNKINRVSVVTKANVIKTTDGKFLKIAQEVAKKYPDIEWDDWYIDIMTAKLLDPKRRAQFRVVVLPNLYGDIITDEAAQIQGGVGTAGSANIGKKYAMFEAIHGSAPRMVEEGRVEFADPQSILRACVMLLGHVGFQPLADKLEGSLDTCFVKEQRIKSTGHPDGASSKELADYVIEKLEF
jgi:isocitrate dehydrogenase (NAD+)